MNVGFAVHDITPTTYLSMDGYADRSEVSSGTLNPLYTKACVIKDNNDVLVMISIDILGVDQIITSQVKQAVSDLYNIPTSNIVLNASHTHGAPAAARFGDLDEFFILDDPTNDDIDYYQQLPLKIIQCVQQAFLTMQQGFIRYFSCPIHSVSSNRVDPTFDAHNEATLFLFEDTQQQLIGMWTIFANHPTVLDATNTLYTNDFISSYHEHLEKHYPDAIFMYLQGCAGDISSRYVKSSSTPLQAQLIGETFAKQILACDAYHVSLNSLTSIQEISITFDKRVFDEEVDLQQQTTEAYNAYTHAKKTNTDPLTLRKLYVSYQGKQMANLIKEKVHVSTFQASLTCIDFDKITLISTPTETFSSIAKDIQQLNPSKKTVVLGYTNGYVGYLVDKTNMDNELCYEKNMMVIQKDSFQKVIKKSQQLLNKVKGM